MHISFTAHNSSQSTSSFGLIDYLDKENQAYETNENETGQSEKTTFEKEDEFEAFFDGAYSENNTGQRIDTEEVVNNIDGNRGTQNLKQSNFYMLNVSPNKKELEHMEHLANEELQKRGLAIHSENELLQKVYQDQKNELMKMQMKLYAKDLMTEYANNFEREIYVDESKLPDRAEKKALDKEADRIFNEYLKSKGIERQEEKQPEKSSKWVETDKLTIIDEKGKSYLAEFNLGDNSKAEVYVPKKMLQEQENGTYKLPENLYLNKEREARDKTRMVEIGAKHSDTKTLKNKDTVHNFELKDARFNETLKMSFKESDMIKKNGKFLVSQHLLKEKQKLSLEKAIQSEHGEQRDKIYSGLAKEKGFNLDKRKLTVNDLMWYGKVENQRTHKPTDKYVIRNNETLKDIEKLSKNKLLNQPKIKALKENLIRDKSGNVIKAGMKKVGLQYHLHLVVSRHDKTMQKPENKISLSPLANHKSGKMYKGADVGFNRDRFFQKGEDVFDTKFNYDRSKDESYEAYKQGKKSRSQSRAGAKIKGELKGVVMKHTGLNQVKQELSPIQSVKSQLGVANIPTRIPKTPLQLAYRVGKKIIQKGLSY